MKTTQTKRIVLAVFNSVLAIIAVVCLILSFTTNETAYLCGTFSCSALASVLTLLFQKKNKGRE